MSQALGAIPKPGRLQSGWFLLHFPDKDVGDHLVNCTNGHWREGVSGRLLGCPCAHSVQMKAWCPFASHHPCSGAVTVHPRGPGGLWSSVLSSCPFPTEFSTVQAVQATMILSTILCCIAFLIFVLQLFRLKQGERFVLTSIIQLMSCK